MTIPSSVLNRLPRYYRCLRELLINNVLRISSAELGTRLKLTSSQVRTDLSYVGSVGQQGYGYSVKQLYTAIGKTMGVGDGIKAIVISERFSPAFNRSVFESRGVELMAVFAENCENNGSADATLLLEFEKLVPFCKDNTPDLAVILPIRHEPRETAEKLKDCGIKGIWNFSSVEIDLNGVTVKNTPLSDMLMILCCEIRNGSINVKE